MLQSNTRAHTIQTVVILLPILGTLLAIYISIRTDLSQAVADNLRQDSAIVDIRREEKEYATEMRGAWREVRELLSAVQRDAAVAAAMRKK